MKTSAFAFIFARGGSKGVPRKNIRPLGGKPLIAYAIETGLHCESISRVFVSTDDPEIAAVARQWGADVPFMRPPELARDDTPERMAWRHAIETVSARQDYEKMDIFVSLPPTAPLRAVEDVEACIDRLQEGGADMVLAVKRSGRHPAFNMVRLDRSGYAHLFAPPKTPLQRRQEADPVYEVTTVAYAARPEFILQKDYHFDGRVQAVEVPEERSIDIDTECDLAFAEFMLLRTAGSSCTTE